MDNPADGSLYDLFDLAAPPSIKAGNRAAFIKSTDDDATWTQPKIIATLQTVSVLGPNTDTSGSTDRRLSVGIRRAHRSRAGSISLDDKPNTAILARCSGEPK